MELPILMTLIICGTVIIVTILGLLFTMWVINKGIAIEKSRAGR